jgi:hypothetical protein
MKNDVFNDLLNSVREAGAILRGQNKPVRRTMIAGLPLVLFAQTTDRVEPAVQAAAKYVPGVSWCARSVIAGNFSCRDRTESAILGTSLAALTIGLCD